MHNDIGEEWLDKAIQYAIDVRDNTIPACEYVRLSVKRWFDDLATAHLRGLYFDEQSVIKYFRFIGRYCRHSEGEWSGTRVVFEPWQCFIEANVHGWKRTVDGSRRFRIAYEEVARKNGKTLRMAANGLYYLCADDESGAQVYSAATKRDQAREIFDGALEMVRQDRSLSRLLLGEQHKIKTRGGRGKFLPLSRDAKRMDGFNVHAGLIDEVHAHENSSLYNVVRSGTAARRQPIMRMITTAGFDRRSFCYDQRSYAIKVLQGVIVNDAYFAIIYTIDKPENWDDETEWHKANPNLGVSLSLTQLREQFEEAKEVPDQKVEFLTKRLNIWTYGEIAWMNMERWNACRVEEFDSVEPLAETYNGELVGCEVYGGLDLAAVEDLCSFTLVFTDGEKRRVVSRSYLPQTALERRLISGDKTLEAFRESGHLIVTPGAVVDYEFIKKDIELACELFDVKGIAYDRWNSSQLVSQLLENEVPMVQFGQGFVSMNAPMKELMRLALTGMIEYNDGLLTWALSNVVATKDPAGNIKPDKSKVSEKIDPAVSLIMGIALAMKPESDDTAALNDFLENPIRI